jgi:hypothetical protein
MAIGHGNQAEKGAYKFDLKDSHVEDICEVVLVLAPLKN